jgi:hypothetical protein
MANDFSRRVGSKSMPVGRGFAPSVQDIADLSERQRQGEKNAQPQPSKDFAAYLAQPQSEQTTGQHTPIDAASPQTQATPKPTTRQALGQNKRIIRG